MNDMLLKADKYYKYLTEEQKDEITKLATLIVKDLENEYSIHKIKKILKKEDFQIIKCENKSKDFIFRARIEIGKTNKIYIYEDTIFNSLQKFENLTYDQLYNMYLAHEFFHYLEYKQKIKTEYYITKKHLFFNRKLKVLALSEMCANLFAQKIANSNISQLDLDLKEMNYEL